MRTKTIGWSLAASAIVASAAFIVSRTAPGRASENAKAERGLARELAELKSEVRRLEAQQRASSTRIALPVASNRREHEANEEPAPAAERTEPLTPEEKRAEERATREEVALRLDARAESERTDATWAPAMNGEIRAAVAAHAAGATVASSDCRASLCKVVLQHESAESQTEIARKLAPLKPFQSGTFYRYDSSSKPASTTLYIVREGMDFHDLVMGS
jgi:hypothetical protein